MNRSHCVIKWFPSAAVSQTENMWAFLPFLSPWQPALLGTSRESHLSLRHLQSSQKSAGIKVGHFCLVSTMANWCWGKKKNREWNGKKESNPKDQSCLYSCFPISWGALWPVQQSAPEGWDLLSAAVSLQGGIWFRWRKCLLWQWLICLTWHSPVPMSPSFSSAKSQFRHFCVRSLKKWVKATRREKIGGWVGLVENRIAQDLSSEAKPPQLPGA